MLGPRSKLIDLASTLAAPRRFTVQLFAEPTILNSGPRDFYQPDEPPSFFTLVEAMVHAQDTFERFWAEFSDSEVDHLLEWGVVVAVFLEPDESGNDPVFVMGDARSPFAPWHDGMN